MGVTWNDCATVGNLLGTRLILNEFVAYVNLGAIGKTLDPKSFVRIHRSYVVNLERVARIEPYGKESRIAILSNGAKLPVSRAGYARLQALLDERG